jgi:hypothetical protein
MIKPKLPQLTEKQTRFLKGALSLFKVEDKPAFEMLTLSQKVMFYTLVRGDIHRIQIVASTQYGKSLVVSLASLYLSCIEGKLLAVIAPSKDKAKIIMRYYIDHLGDNEYLYQNLERGSRLDRLKMEDSKERIILNNGGGIFVVSANEKNSLKSMESAMGMGAEYVIGDEYCLINDNTEATIFRMIAGKGPKATYVKIGNPFYTSEPYSHFKKSWDSGRYERIFINDEVGIKEGRYSKEFLEEAKTKPLYDILFKSEFPAEEEIDRDGFRILLSSNHLKFSKRPELKNEDEIFLGVDIGGGGDKSKFVCRQGNFAWTEATLQTTDTMLNVDKVIEIVEKYGISYHNVKVDDTGIGRGVSDMLAQKGFFNSGVSFGSKAMRDELFTNRRAEMYWDMADWVKAGGVLDEDGQDWIELTWTKYKVQTGEKRIIMEDKERIKSKFKKSPDTADAFVLTFHKSNFIC